MTVIAGTVTEARIQRHRAGEVQPLLAFGHRAPDNDVLDISLVESGQRADGFFEYGFAQILRPVCAKLPFFARPTAVRVMDTMTASFIEFTSLGVKGMHHLVSFQLGNPLIPQCLTFGKHILHALLGFQLTAKTQKRFALQIQHILLRHQRSRLVHSPQPTLRELIRNQLIMRTNIAASRIRVSANLHNRFAILADDAYFLYRLAAYILLHPSKHGLLRFINPMIRDSQRRNLAARIKPRRFVS